MHTKHQSLIESFQNHENLKGIRIIAKTKNFGKRVDSSMSYFFKQLKNSQQSIQGKTNRKFFKDLSGCYFSLEEIEKCEIIILYDSSLSNLNQLQVTIRIKKILGIDTEVEFGDFDHYENRIKEMLGIERKIQTFGNFYFKRK
jgi:hypothetical protein